MSEFAKPYAAEQLKDLRSAEEEHPELRGLLSFRRAALMAQREVEQSPGKGTKLDLGNPRTVKHLEGLARRSSRPIAQILTSSLLERDLLLQMCDRISRELAKYGGEVATRLVDELKTRQIEEIHWLEDALKGNIDGFEAEARRLETDPSVLFFVASMLIQPCLEEVARGVTTSFLDEWGKIRCPVCGRQPSIARRRGGKRYLDCSFCGAEYTSDPFVCVHCHNRDPYTLKFIVPDDLPGLQVDFCEKCRHYLKVIEEEKVRSRFPRGLEDPLTQALDLLAADAGLAQMRPLDQPYG